MYVFSPVLPQTVPSPSATMLMQFSHEPGRNILHVSSGRTGSEVRVHVHVSSAYAQNLHILHIL